MNNAYAFIAALVAALGGAGGIAAIIKQLVAAAKIRAEAKNISVDGHRETQRQVQELTVLLRERLVILSRATAEKRIDYMAIGKAL